MSRCLCSFFPLTLLVRRFIVSSVSFIGNPVNGGIVLEYGLLEWVD